MWKQTVLSAFLTTVTTKQKKNEKKKKERKTATTLTKHAKSKSWKGIVLAQVLRDSVHQGETGRCLKEGTAGDPRTGTPHTFTTPEARSRGSHVLTLCDFLFPPFVWCRTIAHRTVRSTFKTGFLWANPLWKHPHPCRGVPHKWSRSLSNWQWRWHPFWLSVACWCFAQKLKQEWPKWSIASLV